MRICDPDVRRLTLELEPDEVKKYLAGDLKTHQELAINLQKFDNWCTDVKRIRTKRILKAAQK